jgi:hypothetical protein
MNHKIGDLILSDDKIGWIIKVEIPMLLNEHPLYQIEWNNGKTTYYGTKEIQRLKDNLKRALHENQR